MKEGCASVERRFMVLPVELLLLLGLICNLPPKLNQEYLIDI